MLLKSPRISRWTGTERKTLNQVAILSEQGDTKEKEERGPT